MADADEAETWAVMCQDDWSFSPWPSPNLIELRGEIIVLYWDAKQAAGADCDPDLLFRTLSNEMEVPVHAVVCHDGVCFEFYRAVRDVLTLLDQPEEGDLGVVAEYFLTGTPSVENNEQVAQSAIVDAVALADDEGEFAGIGPVGL